MEKPVRKHIRLPEYDYSQNNAYFITICTFDKKNIFGRVTNGKMYLNEAGKIALNEIEQTTLLRTGIKIEHSIVMPNHVHMIIELCSPVGTRRAVSERIEEFGKPTVQSIPTIVRAYKSAVTKKVHEMNGHGTPCPYERVWQTRYYDHVIRNRDDYRQIAEYIIYNPVKWENDRLFTRDVDVVP